MSTYKELMQTGRQSLKQHKIEDADVDAWYLLSHVFQISRTDLLLKGDHAAPMSEQEQYLSYINLRAEKIPLQHITGTQEFMGLEFIVNKDVLIPRQDTETLVEEVLKESNNRSILDMCTGSGCIIISLEKLGKPSRAVGVDISDKALLIATANATKLEADIEFLESDLFEQIEGSFDIIVSNPPYIPTAEIAGLMTEVREHEPRTALDGREDGLFFYRKISAALEKHLNRGGYIFYEIGHDQGEAVKQILLDAGMTDVTIKKDLSGLDRVVSARRP